MMGLNTKIFCDQCDKEMQDSKFKRIMYYKKRGNFGSIYISKYICCDCIKKMGLKL